jgi:sulfur-oxidizing protein SoxZ
MRVRFQRDKGIPVVKVIIEHPMETGQRREATTGKLIPAHFIQSVWVELNGSRVVNSRCSGGVAKDPYFGFRLADAKAGDRVTVHWEDNRGATGSAEARLKETV